MYEITIYMDSGNEEFVTADSYDRAMSIQAECDSAGYECFIKDNTPMNEEELALHYGY